MSFRLLNCLVVGFAIFAMFFGAGNLVYPLYIGAETSPQYYFSTLGITLTGVVLPFLGLVAMILYKGNVSKFFGGLSNYTSFPLIIIILALIGPIAAIPRCIVISFGGFKALIEGAELFWFDVIFCFFLLISVWHKAKVVEILGKWLTPILIIGIIIIVICALRGSGVSDLPLGNIGGVSAFLTGALQGYQTLDLCAAIFFGVIVCDYIKSTSSNRDIISNGIISCIIGLFLLFLVYVAFVYIGAKYWSLLLHVPREQMLITVTQEVIGKFAAPIVGATILVACLTTAIALVDLVANWITDELKILKRKYAVIVVVLISFIFALFGFAGLTKLLATVLFFLYPALIAVTLANITDYVFKTKTVSWAFWVVCFVSLTYNLLF